MLFNNTLCNRTALHQGNRSMGANSAVGVLLHCLVSVRLIPRCCAGVLSLIFGVIIAAYSVINLGRSFSPLVTPRKNNSIITTGLYQYMRHPLYVGFIMLAFGLSAVCYDESRLMLSCLLALILNYKSKKEEEAMLEKHGTEYKDYMADVSRFVPTF